MAMLRKILGMRRIKYRPEGELEQAVWEDESVFPDYATMNILVVRWLASDFRLWYKW